MNSRRAGKTQRLLISGRGGIAVLPEKNNDLKDEDGVSVKTKLRRSKYNLLLAAICAGQSMFALTVSGIRAGKIDSTAKMNLALYFCGTVLLFLLFLAASLVFRRHLIAVLFCLMLFNTAALVNYYELKLHGMVLTQQDLKNIPTAVRQLGNNTFQLTLAVKCIIISFLAAVFCLSIFYNRAVPLCISWRAGFLSAVVMMALGYILVFSPFTMIGDVGWSWELKYYTDSFVIGILENMKRTLSPIRKPEGYSLPGLREKARPLPGESSAYPDIILVLNETYYDVDHLADFATDVPYMRHYDALDAFKGFAAVPFGGGGTNASEYELLTGNSITVLNTSTPFNDLNFVTSRNIAEYLKKLGYSTMAAHSEPEGNYHRGKAWKELGFDSVYFKPDFKELTYYKKRWFASDSSVFRNFCRFYEAMPETCPRFAYLLTIQNHGDWNRNDPAADTVHIGRRNGLSDYDTGQMNEFLTCMGQTDDLIEEMIQYFSSRDRDVVLYMVGDHCPNMLNELAPESAGSEESPVIFSLKKRQVPFFIWSSIAGTDYEGVLSGNHSMDLCALTPCALKIAGLPLSPYYHQLIKLSEDVQCITGIDAEGKKGPETGFLKSDGTTHSIYSSTDLSELVKSYFCMEYNNLHPNERDEWLFDPE